MRILLIGASGLLGNEVLTAAYRTGHEVIAPPYAELNLIEPDSVAQIAVWTLGPCDIVVNCAAFTAVDLAETEIDAATELNTIGPGYLSRACAMAGVRLIHVSTDFVFDGAATKPYTEANETNPLGVYGKTKRDGEEAVLAGGAVAHIVRTSWLYGRFGKCFPTSILTAWQANKHLKVVADQFGCPTSAADLANTLLRIAESEIEPGIYHAAGPEAMSWHEFAQRTLHAASEHTTRPAPDVAAIASEEWPTPAPRPKYSVLDCTKLQTAGIPAMRPFQDSLKEYIRAVLP